MRRISFYFRIGFILGTIGVLISGCHANQSVGDSSNTPQSPTSNQLERASKENLSEKTGLPALTTVLNQLYNDWQLNNETAIKRAIDHGLEIEGDRVKIMLIMLDEGSADDAADVITELGGEVIDRYQTWIDAWVPIGSLNALADLPGVSQVREPIDIVPLGP